MQRTGMIEKLENFHNGEDRSVDLSAICATTTAMRCQQEYMEMIPATTNSSFKLIY